MVTGLLDSEAVMLPPWASEVALAIQVEKLFFTDPRVTVRGGLWARCKPGCYPGCQPPPSPHALASEGVK